MATHKLTAEIITAAVEGFEQQKLRIDAQIAELRKMLTGTPTDPAATPEVPRGWRRKMSAAARKRIGDAQRKRWAESKKTSSPVAPKAPKPKRKLSTAGKKAIVEATKKRWAAFHAANQAKKPALKKEIAKKKLSPARKAALVANLAKARAAKAAKATDGAQ
jgi:hypothetical protein